MPRSGHVAWGASLTVGPIEASWKSIVPPTSVAAGTLCFRLRSISSCVDWIQDVHIISRRMNPGGLRRWFVCSQCRKACSILYLRFDEERWVCWRDSQEPEFRKAVEAFLPLRRSILAGGVQRCVG